MIPDEIQLETQRAESLRLYTGMPQYISGNMIAWHVWKIAFDLGVKYGQNNPI